VIDLRDGRIVLCEPGQHLGRSQRSRRSVESSGVFTLAADSSAGCAPDSHYRLTGHPPRRGVRRPLAIGPAKPPFAQYARLLRPSYAGNVC
jgi:hypothetical protein